MVVAFPEVLLFDFGWLGVYIGCLRCLFFFCFVGFEFCCFAGF